MSAPAFDNAGEYAAGWDAAVWNASQFEGLTLDQLASVFGDRATEFERLAAGDELHYPESAAYKAGAAYAYRMAHAATLEVIATRPTPRAKPS
ncbi:hypothetical protein [uncultured Gordonia sp.]|uniref:hypothetical protein n=1 Tax=uncultured Gordonia sp. TaxID=198437 RepID=UPI002592341A|nr:hypothetical protein [uncultured Gordonia sp.]